MSVDPKQQVGAYLTDGTRLLRVTRARKVMGAVKIDLEDTVTLLEATIGLSEARGLKLVRGPATELAVD